MELESASGFITLHIPLQNYCMHTFQTNTKNIINVLHLLYLQHNPCNSRIIGSIKWNHS